MVEPGRWLFGALSFAKSLETFSDGMDHSSHCRGRQAERGRNGRRVLCFEQVPQHLPMDGRRERLAACDDLVPRFHRLQPPVVSAAVMGRKRRPVDGDLPSAYLPDYSERLTLHDPPDTSIQRRLVATLPSVQFPVDAVL